MATPPRATSLINPIEVHACVTRVICMHGPGVPSYHTNKSVEKADETCSAAMLIMHILWQGDLSDVCFISSTSIILSIWGFS